MNDNPDYLSSLSARYRPIHMDSYLVGKLDLSFVPSDLRDQVREAFRASNIECFRNALPSRAYHSWLDIVYDNQDILKEANLYELHLLCALVLAYRMVWPQPKPIKALIDVANPTRLRDAGDPLPDKTQFTLYRGCKQDGNIRGFFWTGFCQHALKYAGLGDYEDPAVYQIQVHEDAILSYYHIWNSEEYLVLVPEDVEPVLVY